MYHHGGDIFGMPDALDFSININPLGMPAGAKAAARRSLEEAGRYPDWRCRTLTAALQEYYQRNGISVSTDRIVWGNGAAELIYVLCESMMLQRGSLRAFIPAPTFSCYEEAVTAVGGRLTDRIGDADLVFICNPNNPTGSLWEEDQIESMAEICAHHGAWLCVDESFLPFLEQPERKSVLYRGYPAVILLRSLTKIYAMPGLRLGFLAAADKKQAERLRALLQPWNVSLPAQAAGAAALTEEGYLEKTRLYIRKEKEFLLPYLKKTADTVREGEADFFFLKAEEGFADRLLKKKIVIRRCADIRGLTKSCFRIGIRTHEDNVKLAEALSAVMHPR